MVQMAGIKHLQCKKIIRHVWVLFLGCWGLGVGGWGATLGMGWGLWANRRRELLSVLTLWSDHAGAKFMQKLKGRLIAR